MCRGRVRVQLKNSDESFVNEKFQSSKDMMLNIQFLSSQSIKSIKNFINVSNVE